MNDTVIKIALVVGVSAGAAGVLMLAALWVVGQLLKAAYRAACAAVRAFTTSRTESTHT